jgi:Pyruvate/2-oxoacid:ferredoxin oxidoreductase gamma subunit
MVMLGAYNAVSSMFDAAALEKAVRAHFAKGVETNLRALATGEAYAKQNT